MATLGSAPLHARLVDVLTPAIVAHVFALAGVDQEAPDGKGAGASDAPRTTWADHHRKLFLIATGWLGWTPADAWEATPVEILTAYEGRVDMLRTIFGGKDEEPAANLTVDDKLALVFGGFNRKRVGG
jgi:hypothetical protein